jgi:hypothetical protein
MARPIANPPPRHKGVFHGEALQEFLQERVSSGRNRINSRGVKRKMSNYALRPRELGRVRASISRIVK